MGFKGVLVLKKIKKQMKSESNLRKTFQKTFSLVSQET